MLCPICDGNEQTHHLTLENSAIYQHPIDSDLKVPSPFTYTINYNWCLQCGHSFQVEYDIELLNKIYASHYYTPAPEGVGVLFRDEFFNAITSLLPDRTASDKYNILEIGSSTGEVLAKLKELIPLANILGFEPNDETSNDAIRKGIPTRKEFFDTKSANKLDKFDLIVSRHVIEHLANFDEFFNGINKVTHTESILILETPSLDYAEDNASTTPFHIEHLHVFSAHSLAKLAKKYGWYVNSSTVSSIGNLIMTFKTKGKPTSLTRPECKHSTMLHIELFKKKLQEEVDHKKIILWGAGSGGRSIISLGEINVSHLADGNIKKKGKVFCGLSHQIEFGPDLITRLIQQKKQNEYIIIIGSTFSKEIRKTLNSLGWQGSILSPYEW